MRALTITSILTLTLLGGCVSSTRLTTPNGFVELDDDRYDYRATNADGVVIAIRQMDNDPHGDLSFWAGVLDRRLRRSYEAEARVDVEGPDGVPGIQLRYRAERDGRTHRYWTTVFVTDEAVYVLEAGGDAELFEAHADAVESALLTADLT